VQSTIRPYNHLTHHHSNPLYHSIYDTTNVTLSRNGSQSHTDSRKIIDHRVFDKTSLDRSEHDNGKDCIFPPQHPRKNPASSKPTSITTSDSRNTGGLPRDCCSF